MTGLARREALILRKTFRLRQRPSELAYGIDVASLDDDLRLKSTVLERIKREAAAHQYETISALCLSEDYKIYLIAAGPN